MSENTVTSADGTTIAYSVAGEGDLLVLIDGATAYRATTPEDAEIAALLADGFRVVAYDRRGRGGSGDTAPYAVEREIEDLAALIAATGDGRPVTLFGWSSGALLALHAAQAGVPVTRLALFEPPVVADDARPPLPADYVEQLDAAVAEGRRGDAVELFMTAAAGLPPEMVAGMRHAEFWGGLEAIAPTIAYDGRIVGDTMSGRPLPADLWDRVDAPVLVLHGVGTWPHLAGGSRAVAEHLRSATLEAVPGENHSATAETLAPVLRRFMDGD